MNAWVPVLSFALYKLYLAKSINYKGVRISSSYVRDLIYNNHINDANECLGRKYEINGIVIKGKGIGSKIGFPTANIKPILKDQLIPGCGVYFISASFENKISSTSLVPSKILLFIK